MPDTQDSNATGARIAEETTPGVLPGTPIWHPMEPNSYDDFGGELETKARNPLNPSRQRRKGAVVDLDASGGFNNDFTETGLLRFLQGFVFADAIEMADTQPLNGTQYPITAVVNASDEYTMAAGGDEFTANDLIWATGFPSALSNGLKTVSSAIATSVVVTEGVGPDAAAPASARLQKVGIVGVASDLDIVMDGTIGTMVSTTMDFLTEGFLDGEWVYIDGFTTAGNNGFARIDSVSQNELRFGKSQRQMANEAPAGAIRIFRGKTVRNADDPAEIVKRTYQIERTLGRDDVGTMSEYLIGAVANELTITVEEADLIMCDLAFVAQDHEQRNGTTGVKSGTRPSLVVEDAYNTSTDVRRFLLSIVDPDVTFSSALFAFASSLEMTINNNVSPNKAIGVLGAFSMTVGKFEVDASMEAYFSTIEPIAAIRNNSDVTVDLVLVKNNAGWVFDIPLVALGEGRLEIEEDEPITLPIEAAAGESHLGYTLSFTRFAYLPDEA